MLFWLPTPLVNVFSHFWFYRTTEMMSMAPVLVALASHRVSDVDWFSSED